MARPTKIRNAKTAQDFRDAVVERWHQIWRRAPPLSVDERERPVVRRGSFDSSTEGRDEGGFGSSSLHVRRGRSHHVRPGFSGRDDDE